MTAPVTIKKRAVLEFLPLCARCGQRFPQHLLLDGTCPPCRERERTP